MAKLVLITKCMTFLKFHIYRTYINSFSRKMILNELFLILYIFFKEQLLQSNCSNICFWFSFQTLGSLNSLPKEASSFTKGQPSSETWDKYFRQAYQLKKILNPLFNRHSRSLILRLFLIVHKWLKRLLVASSRCGLLFMAF